VPLRDIQISKAIFGLNLSYLVRIQAELPEDLRRLYKRRDHLRITFA